MEEPESEPLRSAFERLERPLTSVVGDIELVRVCGRAGVAPEQVEAVRRRVSVVALTDAVRQHAGELEPFSLRTIDAIHLASALGVGEGLGAVVTYDRRLADAATAAGLKVLSPS